MGEFSKTLASLYDPDGNRTRLTHPDGIYFTYGFDGLDRLNSAIWTTGSASTPFMAITYDAAGRRADINRASSFTGYGYDGVSRLTSMNQRFAGGTGNANLTFGYNPASSITSESRDNDQFAYTGLLNVNRPYATNGLNQYTAAGPATFTYDANGNLLSDGTKSYVYDAENRLISSGSVQLVYDPMGRLWQTSGGPFGNTRFLYDGDQLAVEYDGDTGGIRNRYMFAGEDEPILADAGGLLNCSGTKFLHTDHHGSIVALADCYGNRTSINSYDEYGIPGSANTGRFQYTGQAWIPELGIYYYKARFYSPTLGRFLQTDPIGYKDQINLYAYVANDPVDGRDPTGLYECSGNKEQCGAVSTAYNRASDALKSGDLTKGERTKLQGALGALGAPGQKNGVTVSFATPKEIASKTGNGFAYTDKTNKGISVVLPNNYAKSFDSWKNNPASPVGAKGDRFSPGDARANALAHEGTHVKQFERGMTQEQYNRSPTPFEREAYRVGNSVNESFGTVSPFPEP